MDWWIGGLVDWWIGGFRRQVALYFGMRWKTTVAVVIGGLGGLGVIVFLYLVFGEFFMDDIRGSLRKNEKLPVILIENGKTVYCRMKYCDFRFPLPKSSRVVQTNLTEGGADTVNGFIDVVTPEDTNTYAMDLHSYNLAEGGSVSTASVPGYNGIMRIEFSYFGDY